MSAIFDVQIFSKTWGVGTAGTLVAVLDEVSAVEISREVSKLSKASFSVPRSNDKLDDISIGKKIQIVRKDNAALEYEGVVAGPLDKDANPVKINTYGKGIHLDGYRTPWSFEFASTQYDDLLNDELLNEYRFFREVTLNDFDDGTFQSTATINVASGVTPSDEDVWIMLATTQASPIRHVSAGTYISDAIDLKGDPIDQVTLIDLDRVRYQAIVGQTGDISVKVRYAADDSGSPGTWSAWSATQSLVIEEEMKHLGITGFSAMATTEQWVQVAFEMSSNTSYSNATWYSPVLQAFEIVGKYEMRDFAIGTIESTTDGEKITASFDSHLQVLNHVADIWGVQWEITNSGTVNAESTIGTDLSDSVRLEEEKNVNVLGYAEDDDELATAVWGLGHGEGLNRLFSHQENYTASEDYGKRVEVWETDSYGQATLDNEATARRVNRDDPIYKISIEVIDIPDTHIQAGDVVWFYSTPLSVDASYQIMREKRSESAAGEKLVLELANEIRRFSDSYIEDMEETKSGVDVAVKNFSSGHVWTGWIANNDTTWKEIAVDVGWMGEYGKAQILQVHESTTDAYTTAGSWAVVEIPRYTDRGAVLRYRRLNTGTNSIRLEISWELWSTRNRQWRTT